MNAGVVVVFDSEGRPLGRVDERDIQPLVVTSGTVVFDAEGRRLDVRPSDGADPT